MVEQLEPGVARVTLFFPGPLAHVHAYLLEGDDGAYTLVDTGLGLPDGEERWQSVLSELDAPVRRIVITHFHPDHVGDAEAAARVTGAEVLEGAHDRATALTVWRDADYAAAFPGWWERCGVPAAEVEEADTANRELRRWVHPPAEVRAIAEGDVVAGWDVLSVPGHSDDQLALRRGGVLVCGDAILTGISPAVALYPETRRDALAVFLRTLERLAALAPRVAYTGHREPVADVPGRASELLRHHDERLALLESFLAPSARTAYDLAQELFPSVADSFQRRFAVAETLAHAEHLVDQGRARRAGDGRRLSYTAA